MPNHSKAVATAIPERKRKAHSELASVVNPSKLIASVLRRAAERKELKRRNTLGLYSLRAGDGLFGVPFCALNDSLALLAQKEILPVSNCYRVATVCLFDGSVVPCKPQLILDKGVSHE